MLPAQSRAAHPSQRRRLAAFAVADKCATPYFFAVAINEMPITFDPAKNAWNIAERGLSFEEAAELDWQTALVREDDRHGYGETRLRVLALLRGRLHAAVVTHRGGDELRVISFRRANRREKRLYEQHQKAERDAP